MNWRGWLVVLLLTLSGGSVCAPAQAGGWSPDGSWIVADRVAIQVFDCSGLLCGRIVWLRNPDLRSKGMCGRTIVWGLTPDGPTHWSGGRFYDPENDSTYDLSADLQPDDTISARIYDGVPMFGRTEILHHIASGSLQGWCS